VAAPELTFRLIDGRQAAAQTAELQELHAAVYARTARSRADGTGDDLAEARHGGYLVGYAAGMPLRPSTSWWRELTTPVPDDVIAEHPGRTFALVDLLVRAPWRRQGIGRTLHDLLLRDRPEERATLIVSPAASAAQTALQNWGWSKIARTRAPGPGAPVADVLVTNLPSVHPY
jgi:GNAT superfamily N-acetyltransferase